jgi:dTDP-4-amino-4,6-dideoxygalactose transaminase
VKLPYVDEYNLARREIAKRYNEYLGDVEGIVTPEIPEGHVVHQYTIRVKGGKRDALADALGDRDIASKVYYPVPCHRLPVYDMDIELPESERAAAEVLSLPIWPQAGAEVQERVADAIREVMR